MRASDLSVGRRRFLRSTFGLAAGVALGGDILEQLDALAPRRVMVPGYERVAVLNSWYCTHVAVGDWDGVGFGGVVVPQTAPLFVELGVEVRCALAALAESFEPGTMRAVGERGRVAPAGGTNTVRVSLERHYDQNILTLDALGAATGSVFLR